MRTTATICILGIFLGIPLITTAQLSVSIQMDPNPSPFISDWKSNPNTIRLVVTNPTGKSHSVRFKGYIEGDTRGKVAETKLDGSIPPVEISPGVSILTAADAHILDKDAVRYIGPTRQEVIQSGRLPDDNFRLCVQVVAYESPHSPLSPEACSRFTVRRLSPPSLIAPADKSTVKAAPTFQWSHVAMGRGSFARYELRLIELGPGQRNIVNAMETGIPLMVRESSLPLYQFLPSDPKLQNGKTYAWRVRAFDPQNKFTFTNDGKSEIWTFTYESQKRISTKGISTKVGTKTGFQVKPNFVFTKLTRLRGTLRTTFYRSSIPAPKSIIYKGAKGKPSLTGNKQPQPGGNQTVKPGIPLKNKPNLQTNVALKKNLPLGGLHLRLYLRTKSNPDCGFYPFKAGGKTFEAEKLVATTTTNPDGTFEFIFFAKDSTGRILKDALIQCGSKEFVNSLTGDLYRYYQIMVDDPHLLSPSDEFKVQPGELLDVGTLYSLVRSYSVTVSVKDKIKGSQLPNMDVRIVRLNRPYDVPPEEGTLMPYQSVDDISLLKAAKAEVIAQGKTNAEGKVTLKYMAKNVGGSDRYHLLVSSPEEGVYYYYTLWRTFKFHFLIGEKDEAGNGLVYDMADINESYNPNIMHAVVLANVKPHKPRIAGRVYRSDNTLQPVKNAKVTLSGFNIGLWPIKTTMTNDSGGFVFDNLDPTGDIPEAKAIFYVVTVEKYGFKKYQSSAIFVELGQQFYTTIQLEPALTVKGRVIDELGRPVSANVRIGQGEWVHTVKKIRPKKPGKPVVPQKAGVNKVIIKRSSVGLLKNKNLQKQKAPMFIIDYDEEFTTPAVTGFRWMFIVPDNQSQFYPETLLVKLPPDADDIGEFTVYIKQHRLAVQAVTITPKVSKSWKAKSSPNKYIPGTSVKKTIPDAVIRVNGEEPDSIDADGVSYFVWMSPSDNATVRVRGPDNSDYVEKTVAAVIDESKAWTFLEVPLALGGALSGTVKVGTVPIPGARVALYDNPADASPLQTKTDNNGKYILHGIPAGMHTFKAAKSKSQYIGDTGQATIAKGQTTTLDFQLTAYNDMDITHLLGFPIEITSLDSVGQDVQIAGSFVDLPGNDQFSPPDTTSTLPFDVIFIKPSSETNTQGIPLAEPVTTPVVTTVNEWEISASSLYKAYHRDQVNGIRVRKPAGRGEIIGEVLIDPVSFTFPGGSVDFGSSLIALATALTGPDRLSIPAITSDGSKPHDDPRGFFVSAEDGSALSFSLYNFAANSDSTNSFFNQDTLSLATTIHSNISSIEHPDIALDVGSLRIHKNSIEPLQSSSSLSIPLEAAWSLFVKSWTIDHNGVTLNSGYADLGPMNVNFTGMKLFPDQLLMGAFDAQNIPIAGIKTLHVTGTADFGIEGGTGHWALAISPSQGKDECGYIGGFPGLNPQDKIKFQNIYLRATGSKNFTVADGNNVTLYKVGNWKINQFFPTTDLMQVAGNLDLHIPNLPIKNFIATYSKKNNDIVFTPDPIAHTISVNGVKIKFVTAGNAPQVFDNQGYHSKVIVSEEGAFALNAMLHRTLAKTYIIVDDGQEVVVGSDPNTKMTAVEGAMQVKNQQWENFWFEGDLQNNNQGGRLHFEVQGDIVANDQEIGVDNIETPFGDIKLVYNFPKERIEGSLHVEKDLSGTKIKGDATLLISGTGKGWYFFCGATFSLPNPKIDGTAAFAVGNYNLEQEQLDQFKQYSYKNQGLPQQFHEFHGFFFEGLAKFPPPVFCPNFDFDFGLVSAYLICQVGANARFGMNFGTVNVYFISIRGIANVEAGVGASIGIACAGLSAGLLIDPYIEGLYQSDGTWYVMGDFPFTLYGSTYVGWGICDSDCCCDLCDKTSASASITLGMKAYVGSDDKYFKFYFK